MRVGTRSMEWSEARRKRATLSSYRTSKISNVLFRRLRVVSRGRALEDEGGDLALRDGAASASAASASVQGFCKKYYVVKVWSSSR